MRIKGNKIVACSTEAKAMGRWVAKIRTNRLGISQAAFAEKLEISRNAISSIESGRLPVADRTWGKICRAIGEDGLKFPRFDPEDSNIKRDIAATAREAKDQPAKPAPVTADRATRDRAAQLPKIIEKYKPQDDKEFLMLIGRFVKLPEFAGLLPEVRDAIHGAVVDYTFREMDPLWNKMRARTFEAEAQVKELTAHVNELEHYLSTTEAGDVTTPVPLLWIEKQAKK